MDFELNPPFISVLLFKTALKFKIAAKGLKLNTTRVHFKKVTQ